MFISVAPECFVNTSNTGKQVGYNKSMGTIAVDIVGFAFNPAIREPVILLKRAGELEPIKSLVPIAMGNVEAQAILSNLQGFEPPRPMTHDLMSNILSTISAEVQRIDIHSFHDGTFFAAITLTQHNVTFTMDARPSDAMALAVRTGTQIYMDQDVFNMASVETSALTHGQNTDGTDGDDYTHPTVQRIYNQIHNFADTVEPSDFKV